VHGEEVFLVSPPDRLSSSALGRWSTIHLPALPVNVERPQAASGL